MMDESGKKSVSVWMYVLLAATLVMLLACKSCSTEEEDLAEATARAVYATQQAGYATREAMLTAEAAGTTFPPTVAPSPTAPAWLDDVDAAVDAMGAWEARAHDASDDVMGCQMSSSAGINESLGLLVGCEPGAVVKGAAASNDIANVYVIWGGYPQGDWEDDLPPSFLVQDDEGIFPMIAPTGKDAAFEWRTDGGALHGALARGDARVSYRYPAAGAVGAATPPILTLPLTYPRDATSFRLPTEGSGQNGLLAAAARPPVYDDKAAWLGYQVFWPREWTAAPIKFTTPNAVVTLEGAWAGVLYDPASGETAFWLEQGAATVQGSNDAHPLDVQGPADGEHVALVMVSAEGKTGVANLATAEVLAARFGIPNALSGMFTVVLGTAGPPEQMDDHFLDRHPWAVLVDFDGNPQTGFSYDAFPHLRGLGTEFDVCVYEQSCCLFHAPDGSEVHCDEGLLGVQMLSPTRVAVSYPLKALNEALGDDIMDAQKMTWRVLHLGASGVDLFPAVP